MPAELKASPQNPLLAPFARGLRSLQELAGQYQVDPRVPLLGGTGVDELLGLPGAASLTEDLSYYGPRALIRGGNVATGGIGTFRPDPRITDVADVVGMAAPLPAAGKAAAKGTASAVNRAMLEGTGPLAQLIPEAARPAFVVKPKGGNWVTGGYHDPRKVVEPLTSKADDDRIYTEFVRQRSSDDDFRNFLLRKLDEAPEYRSTDGITAANEFLAERGEPLLQRAPINRWLETKLTKYIKNEMATPEDPVRLQADQWAEQKQKLLADKDAQIAAAVAKMEEARKARGFTPEMMTASQEQIRQLRKERQFIAEQRGTHLQNEGTEMIGATARYKRQRYGMPEEPFATSRPGKTWEDKADSSIVLAPYQEMLGLERITDRNMALEQLGGKYAAENPEALAYGTGLGDTRGLEFDHMVHELRNALDPQSGLPEELLLSPKDLDKMSVAQVSRHVDKINAWRAVQTTEANMARAGNAATQVVKEYPEAGKRWVELKLPEPTGRKVKGEYEDPMFDIPEEAQGEIHDRAYADALRDLGPDAEETDDFRDLVHERQRALSEQWAREHGHMDESEKLLRDALKYEGEQLSHCVGGYCPDVMQGRSRIFSLRSDEGKPLATIEMQPNPYLPTHEETLRYRPEAEQLVLRDNPGIDLNDLDAQATVADVSSMLAKKNAPPVVNQIKGYRNRAPGEQVDFVLDFLSDHPNVQFTYEGKKDLTGLGIVDTDPKSGTWRTVLGEKADQDAYMSAQQMESAINDVMSFIKEENPDLPRFVKKSDLYNMLGGYEFAEGGLVSADYDQKQIDRIVQNFAKGGAVSADFNPAAIDAAVNKFYEEHYG